MRIITFNDIIKANILPEICFEWVSEIIKSKNDNILPKKISMKGKEDGVFFNTMPSIVMGVDKIGVKLVNRYPERAPSLDSQLLLYDLNTGDDLALMDANWITAMRTGAVAAHSIKLFAKSNFSTLGIIGLGNTARAMLLILLTQYPDKKFTIKLKKYKDQHIDFAERFKDYKQLEFIYCDTYEEIIRKTDVVVSAVTYFDEDICADDCYEEGVLLVPIHTRGFSNCDLFFDKVFADDLAHINGFKNYDKFKSAHEVSEVVNGVAEGRKSDKERIIAYNIGISLHDVYFASKVYDLVKEYKEISLDKPKDKFWI